MKSIRQQFWEFERMNNKEKRDKAIRVLNKVKDCTSEQIKRPIRLSNRTVVLVSPERYKQLQRQRKEVEL